MPPETQSAGRQVLTLGLTGVDTLLARAQASLFATRIPWSAFPFPCCCFKMTKKAGATPDTVPPSRLAKTICCFSMMSTLTSSQTKCKFYRVLIIFYVCSPFSTLHIIRLTTSGKTCRSFHENEWHISDTTAKVLPERRVPWGLQLVKNLKGERKKKVKNIFSEFLYWNHLSLCLEFLCLHPPPTPRTSNCLSRADRKRRDKIVQMDKLWQKTQANPQKAMQLRLNGQMWSIGLP